MESKATMLLFRPKKSVIFCRRDIAIVQISLPEVLPWKTNPVKEKPQVEIISHCGHETHRLRRHSQARVTFRLCAGVPCGALPSAFSLGPWTLSLEP